MLFKNFVGSRF